MKVCKTVEIKPYLGYTLDFSRQDGAYDVGCTVNRLQLGHHFL